MIKCLGFLIAGLLLLPHNLVAQDKGLVERFKRALLPGRTVGKVGLAADPHEPTLVLNLEFALDSSILTPKAVRYLHALGAALSEGRVMQHYVYRIEGHTCSQGKADYNQRLSHKRAQAVVDYLVEHFALQRGQFKAVGYGEARPIASNTTAAGRQKNRRVAVVNTRQRFESPHATGLGLDIQATYVRAGSVEELTHDATLTQRDGYAVEFTPGVRAYVYVCQADSHGNIDKLFPNPKYAPDENPAMPDRLYRVPRFGKWLYLDDRKGKEHLVVIAHREALREPVRLCERALRPEQWETARGVGGMREHTREPNTPHPQNRPEVDRNLESLFVWKRSFRHQ